MSFKELKHDAHSRNTANSHIINNEKVLSCRVWMVGIKEITKKIFLFFNLTVLLKDYSLIQREREKKHSQLHSSNFCRSAVFSVKVILRYAWCLDADNW